MINWSPGVLLEEVEKQVIMEAIRFFQGNKTRTAESLGIAIRTLDYKLAKYRGENPSEPFDTGKKKKNGD